MNTFFPQMKKIAARTGGKTVLLAGGLVAMTAFSAHAQQGQTMEDRLRAQLRITTSQLQQAQNELAVLKGGGSAVAGVGAAPTAPAGDTEKLKKELARSQAAERHAKASGERQRTELTKANEQLAQYKHAHDELVKLARSSEAERQRLSREEAARIAAVAQCEEKNARLYSVSQDILRAYETMDASTLLRGRQPFADESRVKLEQIAQEYGDKLYEGKFDVRAVAVPVSAPAGQ
ncbi:hypothetical protein GCM10007205_00980 [Oxalicibacterium flavum]|uniref:DNA repair protein n=1 Tax=Oxalicibacterium flavum TaxID=179467 RepID=A0A8J2UJE8_9BURK|nr:hypothetical protein [Oxalicibacterium flavum]GGB95553.1 hypothetical protein GCM10007205_00980 [Oxalicibacterium flavum]